ncbi:hypothetical protein GQ600_20796 [Phytophthora cactorum]|nr:hypothetical protein GQ600_20796 [Phytophthora cactorum]
MGPSALHQPVWLDGEDCEEQPPSQLLRKRRSSSLSYTKLDPICVETLCRSLRKVTRAVEAKLAAEMPDQFGLIIDGWTLRPLLEFVKDDADLEDALPTRTENPRLKALHAELTNIESVTKALQSTKVSMADAHLLFDGLITLRASFAKYLGERAEIVYAADFEAACVKIQEGVRIS